MKLAKKLIVSATLFSTLVFSAGNLHADEYCCENDGCGYEECCRSSSLAPAIALGVIAIVAIVAVAVQNTSGHSHCHSH
ncbi:MAG: hypothetical protein WCF65_04700 [Parachlamydiaceae bacterium]